MKKTIFILLALLPLSCAHGPLKEQTVKAFTFRIKPNQELKSELQNFAKENHLQAAVIVSAVGSLKKAALRFANEEKSTELPGFHEVVSLSGTLDGESMHVHMSISDKNGKTIGGHLVEGNIVYTTMEVTLLEQTDMKFSRELDPTYGYKELTVKKR